VSDQSGIVVVGGTGAVASDARSAFSEWRAGWPAVASFMAGIGAGMPMFAMINGFFTKPLGAEFGWSRGQIGSMAAAMLVTSLILPMAGVLADRRGVRILAIVGAATYAGCYLALSAMTGAIWQYFAVLAAMAFVGGPFTTQFLFAKPIVAAFDRSRGFALSIGLCGVPLLSLAVLPVLQHIIATQGWRMAYLAMAPFSLVLGVIAFSLLSRAPRAGSVAQGRASGASVREILPDVRFWLLAVSMIGVNIPIGVYLTSLQPMLSDKGVDGHTAALIGAWYGVSAIFGRMTVGAMLDRLWPPIVGVLTLGAPAAGLLLFFFASGSQVLLLGAGVSLLAIASGAETDVLCYFVSRFFGLRDFGAVIGLLGAICGVAMAVGGMSAGYLFDRFGNYDIALITGATLSAGAACAILASGLVRRGAFT
jgi:MFS family permease